MTQPDQTDFELWSNAAAERRGPPPRLSILTPVYRHDPTALLAGLARCRPGPELEVVLYDDGSADPALSQTIRAALAALPCPARLIAAGVNRGRSVARNRLVEAAAARHGLFLDADMIPDEADFVRRWLALIAQENPTAAFGGISVRQAPDRRDTALHKYIARRSDCRPAADRARDPAQFTATSNLLVRRDVLAAAPFDDGFQGWGWEDVDWAIRASAFGPIRHIDNPATHAGLDPVPNLLRKFREGGPNYGRLWRKHPEAVARFHSFRAARALAKTPFHARLRPLWGWLAADPWGCAPMPLRHAAAKLYRTSIYAEHVT